MYRSSSFDKKISQEMQDPDFAQEYLLGLVNDEEEPMEIEEALRFVINRMGVTEFSKLVGENKSNVSSFLHGTRNVKEETLNKYLAPFKLKVKKILEQIAS